MSVEALVCPRCGGNIKPSDTKCPYCGAALIVSVPTGKVSLKPLKLDWIMLGDYIRVTVPGGSQQTSQVEGTVIFEELWQTQKGGDWVPTGGAFAGFWLESGSLLLNWLQRFYLLDQNRISSNEEIMRDFGPYARQFGQSDQKALVNFEYSSATWKVDDIGRFRVNSKNGSGIRPAVHAAGRFIHASSDGNKALLIEDYENSDGTQDMVWQGYLIKESDIQKG